MQSHINITANGKNLNFGEDFSLDIEDKNPIFNETEMFSYPVELPLEANRVFLANLDTPANDSKILDFEHAPVQIYVEGMPFHSGIAVFGENEEIDHSVSMNVEASRQSLRDLLSDMNCQEVMIPEEDKKDLIIGEKIGDVKVSGKLRYRVDLVWRDGKSTDEEFIAWDDEEWSCNADPQALGFSYPAQCVVKDEKYQVAETQGYKVYSGLLPGVPAIRNYPKIKTSYINTVAAYGEIDPAGRHAKYCNARVCYKHYALDSDGTTSKDTISQKASLEVNEDIYPYWVLDADRPQSGICFYVLYFLECLFRQLGVSYDLSAISHGDFLRLCFFTTHCKFDEVPLVVGDTVLYTEDDEEVVQGLKKVGDIKNPWTKSLDRANQWLLSRGTGGQLELEYTGTKSVDNITVLDTSGNISPYQVGDDLQQINVSLVPGTVTGVKFSCSLFQMIANSENFPNASVTDVLDSLENQFGIKFDFDDERRHVRAYLLRDFYNDKTSPIKLSAKIDSVHKITEKITGVRVGYDAEEDAEEQAKYIKKSVKDYDTAYNYIDYPQQKTITDLTYEQIIDSISSSNSNVYVDKNTGNSYRIKVDSEATDAASLKPVLFRVRQWKGVEFGDCSKINEDFVHEMKSSFQPVDFNDVNYHRNADAAAGASAGYSGTTSGTVQVRNNREQILAAFIDEDMEHEFVEQKIRNATGTKWVNLYLTYKMNLIENYDPSNTDDGNSPLQSYDWGLAVSIMRGGGSDATTQIFETNYDGFGNAKWRTVAGKYAMNSDSIDNYGNFYDYNGKADGIDAGNNDEHFSLMPRAYVQPEWADGPLVVKDIMKPDGVTIDQRIMTRGYVDTFLSEHIYFLLNRKYLVLRITTSPAVLIDIRNHWQNRFTIGEFTGYIDKITYSLSAQDGLKDVCVYMFVL